MLHSGPVGKTVDVSFLLESTVHISFQVVNTTWKVRGWQLNQHTVTDSRNWMLFSSLKEMNGFKSIIL